jgi:hypothetical protein
MYPLMQSSDPDPKRQNLGYFFARSSRSEAEAIPMVPVISCEERPISPGNRWGVILAGGDGMRLRPLTDLICGDNRPKQFCPLFGERTLLGQTLQRSERSISREHLLVSLSRCHSEWYLREELLRPSQRVVQPENKGTAPAIVHSLLSLAQLDDQAFIAILPSDHHYSDEQLFVSALESAFETAALRRDTVVLLGATPDYPEVEYGWIEPGLSVGPIGGELFRVSSSSGNSQAQNQKPMWPRWSVFFTDAKKLPTNSPSHYGKSITDLPSASLRPGK